MVKAPADDFAAVEIHDCSQIKPALTSGQIGDVGDPGLVGSIGRSVLSKSIGKAGRAGGRGFGTVTAFLHAPQAEGTHQAGDAIFSDLPALLAQSGAEARAAIGLAALRMEALQFCQELMLLLGAARRSPMAPGIVAAFGDAKESAEALDGVMSCHTMNQGILGGSVGPESIPKAFFNIS